MIQNKYKTLRLLAHKTQNSWGNWIIFMFIQEWKSIILLIEQWIYCVNSCSFSTGTLQDDYITNKVIQATSSQKSIYYEWGLLTGVTPGKSLTLKLRILETLTLLHVCMHPCGGWMKQAFEVEGIIAMYLGFIICFPSDLDVLSSPCLSCSQSVYLEIRLSSKGACFQRAVTTSQSVELLQSCLPFADSAKGWSGMQSFAAWLLFLSPHFRFVERSIRVRCG